MKYFYTDPLKAAWMTKHFGIKCKHPSGGICTLNFFGYEFTSEDIIKYYIHPDCHAMLEPQVGDMISHIGMRGWRIDSMDDTNFYHLPMGTELPSLTLKADKPNIIQRNGKAWFTPEEEKD